MAMNEYASEVLVRQRLQEARTASARRALARAAARRVRVPVRVRLGVALIAAGEWLARCAEPAPRPARSATHG